LIEKYADEYMYINCIKFIMEVKKGVSFSESSPILNNISGAASWEKVTGVIFNLFRG
jgi:serine/threonine-protein phosphatase 2A activator